MKLSTLLLFLVLTPSLSFAQKLAIETNESDFVIGKSITIKSSILNEKRQLNIYLPASYLHDKSKSYPVIYLFDGSKEEDFIHIAGIVQFGSFSWINMVPESIVVGIGNVDRKRDFTYPSNNTLDQKEFPTSGKSAHFIAFIENELQPYINSKFRTTTTKTVIGQSLGGLLATEILFKKPNLFDNYIIVSPSLWWDDEKLLNIQLPKYHSNKSVYVAVGKEGTVMERTAKALFDKLENQQQQNLTLHFEFLADKTHGDALHIAVYNAFEKIFMPKNAIKNK
ncbi:alpha/beta hydrolase [Thalassotalea marina]|uniref:Esterase n=1 Tax=Thalassotalea marina TaxID=1673741 RepID=A0A919ENG8_9GAMM|nr:alpha/beta hydrolase-fold protein [Thalassotalea marina]GHG01582.1 esterase [Thalassotalea marina]